MKIAELFDLEKLEQSIRQGYITRRVHPYYTLAILHHTAKAVGNPDIEHICGIIVDGERIIARIPPDLCDKENIIIVCFYYDKLIVSSSDNFESEDALLAYDFIVENYYPAFRLLCSNGITAICQRVDDDLALIGTVTPDLLSGGKPIWTPSDKLITWPGKRINYEVN